MSIGDTLINPSIEQVIGGEENAETITTYHAGMTYRMWLIGQIASGVFGNTLLIENPISFLNRCGEITVSKYVIKEADSIIDRLDNDLHKSK